MDKPVTCPTRISRMASSLAVLLVSGLLLAACANPLGPDLSTPLPPEYLPTAAALTLAALDLNQATPTPAVQMTLAPAPVVMKTVNPAPTVFVTDPALPTATSSPVSSPTYGLPTTTLTLTPAPEVQTSVVISAPFGATNTPAPPIPDARIQIYRLGELSKVISPLDVSSRLTCGDGKVVRVELFGEDGRLLARDVRNYNKVPWDAARIGMPLDFEISAAAELGRVVISAEDFLAG